MGGRWEKKYFCTLEARTFINKNIKRVEFEGGNKVFNQEEIMNHVKLVYEQIQIPSSLTSIWKIF